MIEITCTNCQAVLKIDEAFAGGVCRCQHCGTIQTVPAPGKAVARPAAVRVSAPEMAALEALGQASAEVGAAPARPRRVPPRKSKAQTYVIIGSLVATVILFSVLIVWIINRPKGPENPAQDGGGGGAQVDGSRKTPGTGGGDGEPKPPEVQSPNFMGLALKGPSVVYLLDHGAGTTDTYEAIKGGAALSLTSLGAQIKFQVLFWETTSIDVFPADLQYAKPETVDAAKKFIAGVYLGNASRIDKPLEKALAANPAEIVIVTGKDGLDEEWVKTVLGLRKSSQAKIHTICVGNVGSPEALKAVAEKTGGQYKQVPQDALRPFENAAPGESAPAGVR